MLTDLTGERVQANKAIVGRNAFAHEAGIHQDGMLKDRRTYEIMRPEDVGAPASTLVLGKHSGRHAVQKACERLGLGLSRRDIDEIYRRMTTLAELLDALRRLHLLEPAQLDQLTRQTAGQPVDPRTLAKQLGEEPDPKHWR